MVLPEHFVEMSQWGLAFPSAKESMCRETISKRQSAGQQLSFREPHLGTSEEDHLQLSPKKGLFVKYRIASEMIQRRATFSSIVECTGCNQNTCRRRCSPVSRVRP